MHGSLTKEMISHNYLKPKKLQKIFTLIEKFINSLPDTTITSSQELEEEIKKTNKGSVTTVYDGVNQANYQTIKSKKGIRKKLGIPTDKLIVVYTGALIANKGINHLLDAILIITKNTEGIHFVIAGSPADKIKKYIEKNNLNKRVTLINPLSYFDLPNINLASDIAIDPKESNVFQASGKIIQYMAAGLPVVCFDRKNNREYLNNAGYYVKDVSGDGIAKGIMHFFKNQKSIAEKSLIAKQIAKNFSWEASVNKIEYIYKKLK